MARADSRLRSADLSAYPIIRVDEISLLPDDPTFFTHCTRDAYALIESIKAEKSPDRGLVEYLMRQIDLMRREQVQRNAAKRIEALLRGDSVESPSYDMVTMPIESQAFAGSELPTSSPGGSTGAVQALRCDESSVNEASKAIDKGSELDRAARPSSINAASSMAPLPRSRSRSQRRATPSDSAEAEVEVTVSAAGAFDSTRRHAFDLKHPEHSPSVASSSLSSTTSRHRPVDDGALSARVQESLNRSFGVEFVVAPVEKKKRFFLKKKAEIDPEQVFENNRQERRKAAMQRLIDRQKQRQEQRAAQRTKAQKERAAKKSSIPSKSLPGSARDVGVDKGADGKDNNNPFASSDSESISGADDVSDDAGGDGRDQRDVADIIRDNYNESCNASRVAHDELCAESIDPVAISNRFDSPVRIADSTIIGQIANEDRSELLLPVSQPRDEFIVCDSIVGPKSPIIANTSAFGALIEGDPSLPAGYGAADVKRCGVLDVITARPQSTIDVGAREAASISLTDEDEEIGYNDDVLVDETELLKSHFNNVELKEKLPENISLTVESAIQIESGSLIDRSASASKGGPDDVADPGDNGKVDEGEGNDNNREGNSDDGDSNDDCSDDDRCDSGIRRVIGERGSRLTMRSSASSDGIAQNPRRRVVDAVAVAGRNASVSSAGANVPSGRSSARPRGIKSVASEPQMPRMRRGVKETAQQIKMDPSYKCPYESFDMIFSSNYGLDGKLRVARKGESFLATSTYQMMVQMAAAYSEWLEIMEDYSTVFSISESGSSAASRNTMTDKGDGASQVVYNGGAKSRHYRIKSSRSDVCNIIHDVFNQMLKDEYVELPSGYGLGVSWNLLWSWGRPKLNFSQLLVWQKVNHFPESRQLTRKDLLKKNLQALTEMGRGRKSGEYFEIMPPTYLLPNEFTAFVKAFHEIEQRADFETKAPNIWIMKPVGLSRGRGISLVTDVNTLQYSQASVIQRYIPNPLLLGGYKFDLRLYVLVTSVCPLEAFIYTEGFARVSTHKFTLDPQELSNKFIHLTNSSIQKQNTSGPSKDNPLSNTDDAVVGGSKMSLTGQGGLWNLLTKLGVDSEAVWANIKELVIKSLVAVEDRMSFQPNCFEVFGFDVLMDEDLRPWLIEVNASPSLTRDNPLDFRVKNAMIYDTIKLIDAAPFDRAGLVSVLKRRLQTAQSNPGLASASSGRNDPNLAADIMKILGNYTPRAYGEIPKYLGNYERLCPNNKVFDRAVAMKSKIFRSGSNSSSTVKPVGSVVNS